MSSKAGRKQDGTFAKGHTGNPNGRPKKEYTFADIMNKILDEEVDGKTRREIILTKVIQKAYEGERWAVEFMANRIEGKPIETLRTQEIAKDEIVEI